jgi:hypothetical protein
MEKRNKQNKRPIMAPQGGGNLVIWILIMLGIFWVVNTFTQSAEKPTSEVTYSAFFDVLKSNATTGKIKFCVKTDNILRGEFSDGSRFVVNVPDADQDLIRALRENVKQFDIKPPKTLWMNLFYSLGPMLLFILFLWIFAYRSPGGGAAGGGRIWAFGKSRATLASEQNLRRRGERGAERGDRVPEGPEEVPAPRRQDTEGCASDGPAGHRKDVIGEGRRRRGERAFPVYIRLRLRRDVRRRRRFARQGPFRAG